MAIFGVSFLAADAWATRDCLRSEQFETICHAICDYDGSWRCFRQDVDRCCVAGLDEFGYHNGTCGEKAWSDCPECGTGACGL